MLDSASLWEIPPADQLVPSDLPTPMRKLFSIKQHDSDIIDLEFSADGKRLASSSDKDSTTWLWSTETLVPIKRLTGRRLAFSRDGTLLVTCGSPTVDRRMAAWNSITGEPEARFPGRDLQQFGDVLFTPDGKKLIAFNSEGVMRTWNARPPQRKKSK